LPTYFFTHQVAIKYSVVVSNKSSFIPTIHCPVIKTFKLAYFSTNSSTIW
jgi:hypothetical protein